MLPIKEKTFDVKVTLDGDLIGETVLLDSSSEEHLPVQQKAPP